MKKLSIIILTILLSIPLLGMKRDFNRTAHRADYEFLDSLRDLGYVILPEARVIAYRNDQDTIRHKSNYEKYWEEKNRIIDTIPKGKNKPMTIFDRMKESKQPRSEDYNQGYNEGYEDGYDNYVEDPLFYSNRIYRFNYGFSFYFGYPYYSYWNPWYYDSFYYGYGWGYPYYGYGWGYPYYGYGWGYPYYGYGHQANYGTGVLGYKGYGYSNNLPSYRRGSASVLNKNYVNSPKSFSQTQDRRMITNPQDKSKYQPSYHTPKMSERPMYNNSHSEGNRTIGSSNRQITDQKRTQMQQNMNMPNSRRESTTQMRIYSPATNRQNSTPSRSYSAPTRNFNSINRSSGTSNYSNFSNSGGSNRSSVGSGTSNSSGSSTSRRK